MFPDLRGNYQARFGLRFNESASQSIAGRKPGEKCRKTSLKGAHCGGVPVFLAILGGERTCEVCLCVSVFLRVSLAFLHFLGTIETDTKRRTVPSVVVFHGGGVYPVCMYEALVH